MVAGKSDQTIPQGIWVRHHQLARKFPSPGLLLDRDGVLVQEQNYLRRAEDVVLQAEAVRLLRWANDHNILVAVTTNQSGIDRGLISWDAFEGVEQELAHQMEASGVQVDLTVACPFHPDFTPSYGKELARWRKPGPAMLQFAAKALGMVLETSWMVGDKASDIAASRAAGLAGAFFWRGANYGHQETEALALASPLFTVLAVDSADALIQTLSAYWKSKS